MRIALVAPLVSAIAEPHLGGAQAMLADLAQGLVQRGHQVTLFAREDSSVPGVHIEPIAVPDSVHPADFSALLHSGSVMDLGHSHTVDQAGTRDVGAGLAPALGNGPGFFAQANLFLELFLELQHRSSEFDLLHAHAFDWPAFACSTLIRNIPVLHTLHLPAISPEINSALQVLHRQGHPLTLITVSHACAHTYAGYTPIDHVIYNGLDLAAIPFAPTAPADAPLLFAGRIAPEKGVEAAIEIAQRAGRGLLIAGGIYDRRYYEERIVPKLQEDTGRLPPRAGASHVILERSEGPAPPFEGRGATGWRDPGAAPALNSATYLGLLERPALWEIMSRSLGLLFPIEWDEPFGLSAVEAMATGTPVIAFRRGAAAEVIQDGVTGFLVEPGDRLTAAALVDKLADLSRAQCRAYVETHFTLEKMIDAYEQVYR